MTIKQHYKQKLNDNTMWGKLLVIGAGSVVIFAIIITFAIAFPELNTLSNEIGFTFAIFTSILVFLILFVMFLGIRDNPRHKNKHYVSKR
ncbi:MAG: hypothetical protein QXS81_04285 [Candidatus Micrarchaeaceae archaeon]